MSSQNLAESYNQSTYNYYEDQQSMIEFVKIIERNADVYACQSRVRRNLAWKKVTQSMQNELGIDCTVKELREKWKSIRATFIRYQKRYNKSLQEGEHRKKYYLEPYLDFLIPYLDERVILTIPPCEGNKTSVDEFALPNWSEVTDINIIHSDTDSIDDDIPTEISTTTSKNDIDEDSQFFKGILPDIAHFTPQEKKKLKIGILKLIDDINKERKDDTISSTSASDCTSYHYELVKHK